MDIAVKQGPVVSSDFEIHKKCECQSSLVDVIFIHGLRGHHEQTWTSKYSQDALGTYWPDWLSDDCNEICCHSLAYPSSLFGKWAQKSMSLYERSKALLDYMGSLGFGNRPIVVIAHSLGGLLTKQLITTAENSGNAQWKGIISAMKLVIFLGTPHTGASLASLLSVLLPRISSSDIETLQSDNSQLIELNESFRYFSTTYSIKTVVYYEKHKTKNVALVVDEKSADPGITGVTPIPVDADHESICKPSSRHAVVYLGIRKHVKDLVETIGCGISGHNKSDTDRRSLLDKMMAANREHEYSMANELQHRFAYDYTRLGLHTPARQQRDNLLVEVQQRFVLHVYQAKICANASDSEVMDAVQTKVIDPLKDKFCATGHSDPMLVMRAIYFLTEQCHIRWDYQS